MSKDVRAGWMNVARRAQSIAASDGYGVVQMTIVVDKNGDPISWGEPKIIKLEPKSIDLEAIMKSTGASGELLDTLMAMLS